MIELELANGVKIPQIGMGTWQINDKDTLQELIKTANELGYSLLDTAAAYSNEISIGKAWTQLGIKREDLFLSDKVWNSNRGFEAVQSACRKSLKKLKTDYLDLYLIHWPASPKLYDDWKILNAGTWRGMEQLYQEGLVRAIGVCNFKSHHLDALSKTAQVMPMVNQVEFHPGMPQQELIYYCRERGICVEASSPLGSGAVLVNAQLKELAKVKDKTVAQICLRYGVEKGLVVLPKTTNPIRLQENLAVYDWELSDEEMRMIDDIPYCGGIGIDPDEVTEFG
ncbi:MAG: aldo/keto reductase [Selenomonas ruminantium]|jgi:diketogulonate reductase-like aldo/keto reductase|uniref:Aldo/keto reductase n=1 Tax=Selenomonas ruminantium TaxID=971 RepID=A0A927WIC2_SELRU|nr:aldo/keto reductase [Selenomonas ruminantium]MBE6084544.1 aldo/keto reductase [Selenomonas ruminantium]